MRRYRAHISTLLFLCLLVSSTSLAFGTTAAELEESREKAAEARQAAQQAQAAADRLREEVVGLDTRIGALESEIRELQPSINEAAARTSRLKADIAALRADVAVKETEIAHTQAEYDMQVELLGERMSALYKQGDLFYLDLLINAENLADLIARTTLVQRVIKANRDVAVRLDNTRRALEHRQSELERALESVQAKSAEAEMVEKNLRDLQAKRKAAVRQQEAVQDEKSVLMSENQANAERLRKLAEDEERESARIAAELRARSQNGSGLYSGVMTWPTPGFYRVSSGFGYRIHPIFKTRRMHTGIDIGSNSSHSINGADIVAADAGTVIFTGRRGGYGVTVMIDHGDGVATLYAHMQNGSIAVSEGESISRGQRLGAVGSTGYSTGPHLHFEVRINGSPVNPMGYLR